MSEQKIINYEIKSFSLLGIKLFSRKRKLLKVNWAKNDNLNNIEIPISILFLAKYPEIKAQKKGLWSINNWRDFTQKLICYSIMEAFFLNSIGITQFEEEIKILNGFIEEKIRRFVMIPSHKYTNDNSWINLKINDISNTRFDKLKSLPHSNLTEQISRLIGSTLVKFTKYSNPQKEFALVYAQNQTEKLEWIHIDKVTNNYLIFDFNKYEVDFKNKSFEAISTALENRIKLVDELLQKDKYIGRFYDRLNEVIEDEFSKRTDNDD